MDIRIQVGQNLKKLRKAAGLSQEALALESGLHRTYVSGVERGIRNPTVEILTRLAKPLGVPSSALLNEQPTGTFANYSQTPAEELAQRLKRQNYLSPDELATFFETQSIEGVPFALSEHIAAHLRGSIAAPQGRPRMDIHIERLRYDLITAHYKRTRDWLQRRQKSQGLAGWSILHDQAWWQGPPAERAARIVAARWLYGPESWRGVQNLSSQKRP